MMIVAHSQLAARRVGEAGSTGAQKGWPGCPVDGNLV
jgi:hypothetical protein